MESPSWRSATGALVSLTEPCSGSKKPPTLDRTSTPWVDAEASASLQLPLMACSSVTSCAHTPSGLALLREETRAGRKGSTLQQPRPAWDWPGVSISLVTFDEAFTAYYLVQLQNTANKRSHRTHTPSFSYCERFQPKTF